MLARFNINNIWKNVKELDLRPIQEAANQRIRLVFVGQAAVGKKTLAGQFRSDPHRPHFNTNTEIELYDLENGSRVREADLVILLVDAGAESVEKEQLLLDMWKGAGLPFVVFYNQIHPPESPETVIPWLDAGNAPVLTGSALDWDALQAELAPLVAQALPEHQVALGRGFPLCRETVARKLIADTCIANAAYSFGTGLAEIVPILDLPLNVADIIVLTKAQALLVYKLGLTLGLPTDWQYYITEFSSVIGSGFLWRQLARSLVGLIPVWGIVPKVAVAYSATYAVGQAVLYWYLTGKHASRKMLREYSRSALAGGKTLAKNLIENARQRRRAKKALPAETDQPAKEIPCPNCGTRNDPDANFCKQCGDPLGPSGSEKENGRV